MTDFTKKMNSTLGWMPAIVGKHSLLFLFLYLNLDHQISIIIVVIIVIIIN